MTPRPNPRIRLSEDCSGAANPDDKCSSGGAATEQSAIPGGADIPVCPALGGADIPVCPASGGADIPVCPGPVCPVCRQPTSRERLLDVAWANVIRQVGKRYTSCRLQTFIPADNSPERERQAAVLEAVAQFSADIRQHVEQGRNIVLFGPPGTGKDHLLVSVLHAALGELVTPETPTLTVRWTNGIDLYSRLRDVIGSDERTELSEWRSWVAPQILYLSDPVPPFGKLSDFQAAFLLRIIDARYRNCRPTYVSLNVKNGEDAAERMGPQVLDRLKHGALVCWCHWPSYRDAETAV